MTCMQWRHAKYDKCFVTNLQYILQVTFFLLFYYVNRFSWLLVQIISQGSLYLMWLKVSINRDWIKIQIKTDSVKNRSVFYSFCCCMLCSFVNSLPTFKTFVHFSIFHPD